MHTTQVIDGIEVQDSHGMWQDKETRKIHSAEGYVFEYVGRYLSLESLPDKPVYKDCSEADFYGDPSTPPPPDANLPGAGCELKFVGTTEPKKSLVP